MTEAYVLIQTEQRKQLQVVKELLRIPGVNRADVATGPYDLIVFVAAADTDSLGTLVVDRIETTDGVLRALICPVVAPTPMGCEG